VLRVRRTGTRQSVLLAQRFASADTLLGFLVQGLRNRGWPPAFRDTQDVHLVLEPALVYFQFVTGLDRSGRLYSQAVELHPATADRLRG
jgi:hypothetical protein